MDITTQSIPSYANETVKEMWQVWLDDPFVDEQLAADAYHTLDTALAKRDKPGVDDAIQILIHKAEVLDVWYDYVPLNDAVNMDGFETYEGWLNDDKTLAIDKKRYARVVQLHMEGKSERGVMETIRSEGDTETSKQEMRACIYQYKTEGETYNA